MLNVRPCIYHPWVPLLSRVLSEAGRSSAMRDAIPLFVCLCLLAHPKTGRVLVQKESLAKAFHVQREMIDVWAERLQAREFVKITSPGDFLVVSIRSWSGKTS
jgi:hypothetical protein